MTTTSYTSADQAFKLPKDPTDRATVLELIEQIKLQEQVRQGLNDKLKESKREKKTLRQDLDELRLRQDLNVQRVQFQHENHFQERLTQLEQHHQQQLQQQARHHGEQSLQQIQQLEKQIQQFQQQIQQLKQQLSLLRTKQQERDNRKGRENETLIQIQKTDYEEQFRVFKQECQETVNRMHAKKEAEKAENYLLRGQVRAFRETTEAQSQEIESLKARLSQLESSRHKSPRDQGEMDHREGRKQHQAKQPKQQHQAKQHPAKGKQQHQGKHPKHQAKQHHTNGKQHTNAKQQHTNAKQHQGKHPKQHVKQQPHSKKKPSKSKSRHQSHNSDDSD